MRATTSCFSTLSGVGSCSCSYVLLSVVLPNKDNLSLLHRLGQLRHDSDILVVSTGSSLSSGISKLRLKTSSCLAGPFRLTRLGTHIGSLVHQQRTGKSIAIALKGLLLCPSGQRMRVGKGPLRLGHGRFSLLCCFMIGPNQIVGGVDLTRSI